MMDARQAYELFAQRDADAAPGLILAVTSTGVFCRAGCPARLPLFKNCRFFTDVGDAQTAGFRACKRCHPLGRPEDDAVDALVAEIAARDTVISEAELVRRGLVPSTIRRAFQRRFGTSFASYQRERGLARAQAALSAGEAVIDAQLDAGFASSAGFARAYAQAFGTSPSGRREDPLFLDWLDTPLGTMVVLADARALHMSEFVDRKALPRQMARVRTLADRPVVVGRTGVTERFAGEVKDYFAGELQDFATPLALNGTAFQRSVWEGLRALPYGSTASYAELAAGIGKPKAVRAAASSNAANALAIIVPCHRIVPKAGGVGGYAGGPQRKAWLLAHEAKHAG